jgi:hypothetical protein
MKRIARAAALTAASCALVMGGAGTAAALDDFGGWTGSTLERPFGHDGLEGAIAVGYAIGSPGFLSGNLIQRPTNFQANVCGSSLFGGGVPPSSGNICINS